jgi:hypothetical protein
MKINQTLFLWILLAGLVAGCNTQKNTDMKRFEWTPTNTAPANYPSYIYRGYFTGADSSLISTPDRQTLYYGWQNTGSGYISGPDLKPVPRQLDLLWLSYVENKYYQAQIELPVEKIENLFKQGYIYIQTRRREPYSTISYGVAPGGFVSVWLIGAGHRVEVATGQGQVTDMAFEDMIPTTNQTQEEHIQGRFKTHLEDSVIAEIKKGKIPFNRWKKTYRTKYRWSPAIVHTADSFTPLSIEMQMYNGERDVKFYDLPEIENDPRKAVPMYFRLEWRDKKNNLFAAQIRFNEHDIFAAFRKLSEEAGNRKMQVAARISRYNDEVNLELSAGETAIPLPNTRVDIFAKDEE